jgi:hypothetical protein
MSEKYKREYETEKSIFYTTEPDQYDRYYCRNGHFCFIPACTEIVEGVKHYCLECGTLIMKVIKIKVIEEEI